MIFRNLMSICRYCRLGCCSACSLITDTDNIQDDDLIGLQLLQQAA